MKTKFLMHTVNIGHAQCPGFLGPAQSLLEPTEMQAKVWDPSPIVSIYYGFAPLRFEFGKSQFTYNFIFVILCLIGLKCNQSSFVPSINYVHYNIKPFSKPPLCAHQEVSCADELKENSPDSSHLWLLLHLTPLFGVCGSLLLPSAPFFFFCFLLTSHLFLP